MSNIDNTVTSTSDGTPDQTIADAGAGPVVDLDDAVMGEHEDFSSEEKTQPIPHETFMETSDRWVIERREQAARLWETYDIPTSERPTVNLRKPLVKP